MRHRELRIDGDGALKVRDRAPQNHARTRRFCAALYAFRASSDGVVACSSGVECSWIVASDSPSRGPDLKRDSAQGIQDLFFPSACACSCARTSPVRQFLARNHKTYWLPRLAIEPSRTAALPVRSQISRAISGVSGVSARPVHQTQCLLDAARPMTSLRNGDCSSCTAKPLAKRLVKDRIARLVFEFGQDNRVLRGEFRRPVKVKICRGEQRQNRGGAAAMRVQRLGGVTAASSRCNSAADCHRRPGSSSRHRFTIFSSFRDGMRFRCGRGSRARQHFVEDAAERVDIRAGIGRFALPLLRRHVGGRAHRSCGWR